MIRILFLVCMAAVGCGGGIVKEKNDGFGEKRFSEMFKAVTLPYEISDTALISNKDTATILNEVVDEFLSDSITNAVFGANAQVKYIPLIKAPIEQAETYFVLKATNGKKVAALIFAFQKNGSFGAAFPLLVPDTDPKTAQVSSIDKVKTVTRGITKQVSAEEIKEGKDVYAYNQQTKSFSLIMTDVLDDDKLELINPIDTLAKTHRLAGDYGQGKKSIVSIRDGRNKNELQFFIHFENQKVNCSGELKGTMLFTSGKVAVYRQGGDPCVLEIHFSPSAVTLKEMEGCGAHRGLDCSFNGTFTKKKVPVSSPAIKK